MMPNRPLNFDLPDREQIYALTRATPGAFEFLVFLLATACLLMFAGMALYAYETEDLAFDLYKLPIFFGGGLLLLATLVVVSLFPSIIATRFASSLAKVLENAVVKFQPGKRS